MQSSPQSSRRAVVLGGVELDAAATAAQRTARQARKSSAIVLLSMLIFGLVDIFIISFWISLNASAEPGLAFFLVMAALLFMIIYFGNNIWQWRILQKYDLHCPHCGQQLGADGHWTKRPGYTCPRCGKEAIATARQLGDG